MGFNGVNGFSNYKAHEIMKIIENHFFYYKISKYEIFLFKFYRFSVKNAQNFMISYLNRIY